MTYIPDPIERGEARAERWAAERIDGDMYTCACGNKCKLEECQSLSPDPYAEPFCPSCVDGFLSDQAERLGPPAPGRTA